MSIAFVKVSNTQIVEDFLVERLQSSLAEGHRVLWLVPGGSSIAIAAAVSQRLGSASLDRLTVSLTDERFGPVDHRDSNWRQLAEAGFGLAGARLIPVLSGGSMAQEVESFSRQLVEQLAAADYALGFFGMGADGHTAGILPGSPAVGVNQLAFGYDAGNYQRITMTGKAIAMLDEAVVYAVGVDKAAAIDSLSSDLPVESQPAQYLKSVNKLTVFNDRKG